MSRTLHAERILPGPTLSQIWPGVIGDIVAEPDAMPLFHTPETLLEEVVTGDTQLWVLMDSNRVALAISLTKIFHYPKGSAFRIMWLKGAKPKFLTSLMDAVESVARSAGCFRVEFCGRKGWLRLLREKGYEELWTVMGRDITKPAKEN